MLRGKVQLTLDEILYLDPIVSYEFSAIRRVYLKVVKAIKSCIKLGQTFMKFSIVIE